MNTKRVEVRDIPLSEIKPYWKNPRINHKAVEALMEVLPHVGFNVPIVVDKKHVIIKGHTRYEASVKLGLETVPVIVSDNDDETNRLDRIADNRVFELSKWVYDEKLTEMPFDPKPREPSQVFERPLENFTVVCPYCGEEIVLNL